MLTGDLGEKKDHREAVTLMRYAAARADYDFPEPLYV